MERDVFDRETLLDLTVNIIPLGIMLFFVLLFLVVAPWGYNLVDTTSQMALLVVPFVSLALLTYYSGKAIARDEKKLEADAEIGATPELDDDTATEPAEAAPEPAENAALEGDTSATVADTDTDDGPGADDEPDDGSGTDDDPDTDGESDTTENDA